MNHSVSQATDRHEAKLRLIKLERKIESNKLGQLKVKLQATSDAAQLEVVRFRSGIWGEMT
jgi:hypothetical protein